MPIIRTDHLSNEQKEFVRELWNQEYPAQLNYAFIEDLDDYLNKLSGIKHFLFLNDSGQIKGWAYTFRRDNEKWFAVLIDASWKGQGIGTLLLNQLKSVEDTLNGWVVDHDRYVRKNGKPYLSPMEFYKKNGFTIHTDRRLEVEKLSAVCITWKRQS